MSARSRTLRRAGGSLSPQGLFFLSFCLLGAPALITSAGCSGEAQASQPTQPSEVAEASAEAASPFWSQGPQLQPAAQPNYDPNASLAPLVARVQPAVVSIQARRASRGGGGGIGSGFIISADGLVVTNHHVVDGNDEFEVHLQDGRRFQGEIVGSDPQTDLAVLRLSEAKGLPSAAFGSSEKLAVGDWVVAMGSPMGLDQTVTRGIVSAKGRGGLGLYKDGYVDFLQTDAAINPGNSGGPLFNLAGEVIGINTAVGGHDGLGFAIPVDQAKLVIPKLVADGKVTRGWLGVSGRDEPPAYGVMPQKGAIVGEVHSNAPAATAGFQAGDRVVEIDGKAVEDFGDLRARIGDHGPGEHVDVELVRAGKRRTLDVELGQRPGANALSRMPATPAPRPPAAPTPDSKAGDLYEGQPARLGVEVRESSSGVAVERVLQGGVGHRLGLRAGDLIQTVNGDPVSSVDEVLAALESDRGRASVEVERGAGRHTASISAG